MTYETSCMCSQQSIFVSFFCKLIVLGRCVVGVERHFHNNYSTYFSYCFTQASFCIVVVLYTGKAKALWGDSLLMSTFLALVYCVCRCEYLSCSLFSGHIKYENVRTVVYHVVTVMLTAFLVTALSATLCHSHGYTKQQLKLCGCGMLTLSHQ